MSAGNRTPGNRLWSWHEGRVDSSAEHIELRYRDASQTGHEQWIPVALVGPPTGRIFPVRWLVDPQVNDEMIADVKRELTFYLAEKRERNPWAYALYHCGTAANLYSKVHWSHYPSGAPGERHSSKVTRRSPRGQADLFGDQDEQEKGK